MKNLEIRNLQIRNSRQRRAGFTLIELLIVIMIIGILAGVLLAVLDPGEQRKRAAEATMRSNVAKLCLAFAACQNSSPTGASGDCDTLNDIGADVPTTPNGASYPSSWGTGRPSGTYGSCTITCGSNNVPQLSGCAIN